MPGGRLLKKLAYVDRLMRSIAGREPRVATLEEVDPLCANCARPYGNI